MERNNAYISSYICGVWRGSGAGEHENGEIQGPPPWGLHAMPPILYRAPTVLRMRARPLCVHMVHGHAPLRRPIPLCCGVKRLRDRAVRLKVIASPARVDPASLVLPAPRGRRAVSHAGPRVRGWLGIAARHALVPRPSQTPETTLHSASFSCALAAAAAAAALARAARTGYLLPFCSASWCTYVAPAASTED